jgi:uncharacterized protein YndB with AHSA1/START domain
MSKPSFVYVTYIATTAEKVWQALTDTNVTRRYWGPLKPDANHTAPFENVSDWRLPMAESTKQWRFGVREAT